MLNLLLGFALAACLAFALFCRLVALAKKVDDLAPKIIDLRLQKCRQRFGQIATRESVGEVRKIAQQAIKELSE